MKAGITHKNNAIPKVIGMNIYSTGTNRIWKTLWLHNTVSVRGGSGNSATYNHGDRREEDAEDKRADGGRDRVQVQEGAVLEDTQPPSAGGEEITYDAS